MVERLMRQAHPSDAAALQQSCWRDWSVEAVQEMLERVDRFSGKGRGFAAVAYQGPLVLGYGQLLGWSNAAEISDLLVALDYRGQGIGTALIMYLTGIAHTWGQYTVEIGVSAHNVRALALYRRLGFSDERVLRLDLGSGPETVIYLARRTASGYESSPAHPGLPAQPERN